MLAPLLRVGLDENFSGLALKVGAGKIGSVFGSFGRALS
jgi:hypothetical protein